jgi:hypothetical protein
MFTCSFILILISRALGPLGPHLLPRFRPDIGRKFADVLDDPSVVYQYLYHVNVQRARFPIAIVIMTHVSGEMGFAALTQNVGFARRPLIERISYLDQEYVSDPST